mmetsp:Transcript_15448/g.18622  ORF Transcript_15448/g.18622 Transcript_15448/m.18622 type:complete len:203 (-) Transcript_15448:77-685(-)|eukprot:CAMPEP_0197855924 /NCGR_PEP_ID=MMETSP1438-20131217/27521_1 /TAXON_ID=1461541 /ORGANISM="Pterosperma sp., Strain CCMP1384" /LENGTH=202 /DNA_ID=CAMNT_0043471187 /DNA_START=175 /DNA_END=783 /DNA_ORIENTATION=+
MQASRLQTRVHSQATLTGPKCSPRAIRRSKVQVSRQRLKVQSASSSTPPPSRPTAVPIEFTVTVPSPREEVFAFVSDFANIAKWDPAVLYAKHKNDLYGKGYVADTWVTLRGIPSPMEFEMKEFVEGRGFACRGEAPASVVEDRFEFDDVELDDGGEGTRVNYTGSVRLRGILSVLHPLLADEFKRVGTDMGEGLVEYYRIE